MRLRECMGTHGSKSGALFPYSIELVGGRTVAKGTKTNAEGVLAGMFLAQERCVP